MNLQILTVPRMAISIIVIGLMVAPAASASTRSERKLQKQVKQLKAENKSLAASRNQMRTTIAALRETQAKMQETIDQQKDAAASSAIALQSVTAARDAETARANLALQGLPNMVRAVPSGDLFTLVLFPARDVWACDSWYQSDGYYSLDFPKCF